MQAFHGLQTFSIYSTVKLPEDHLFSRGLRGPGDPRAGGGAPWLRARDL